MVFTEPRTPQLYRLEPQLPRARSEIDSGTGYEALLGLIMFAGHEPPGEYAVGDDWFSMVRRAASPQLTAAVAELAGGVPTVFGHLLGLVRCSAAPRDLDALIRLVRDLPARQLRLELLGSSATAVRAGIALETLVRAAEGDRGAARDLVGAAADDACWAKSLHAVLELTPERTGELAVEVLARWADEVFRSQEAHLGTRLAEADRLWRAEAERVGWRDFVEHVTGGIVLEEDLPADRVLLVPTVLGAPWVYTADVSGTKIFCCPVREASEPTAGDLVRVLRALGDETRLAILHHLATSGPATLTALTATLGISKSAVHKHLVLLRSAELVRLRLGHDRQYVLREPPALDAQLADVIRSGL